MRAPVRALALLCALATGTACARPYAPPGGERDVAAPRLVSTTPGPLAIVAANSEPVVLRFDERLSERGFSEALLSVSPLDGALRVDRSGADIEVRIDGGWRPNRVYRVVLLPGVSDLFGNERREPVELVFSTGAPVGNTALAGIVLDRLSGAPAAEGVVDAVHVTEGARYTAIADSSGFYSMRYLPIGEYGVSAYDDQNGNRRRDALEAMDSGYTASFAQANDTVALIFNVLKADSSPPRIVGTGALDSLHVRVQFDDHFDPGTLEAVRAEIHVLPDSTRYGGSVRVMPESVFEAEQRAAADSTAIPADTLGVPADTAALPRDTARLAPERQPPIVPPPPPDTSGVSGQRQRPLVRPPDAVPPRDTAGAAAVRQPPSAAQADTVVQQPDPATLLPTREIVIRLDRPLVPGSYAITVSGIVNLHGLAGGGTAHFTVNAPAPPSPPDTTNIGGPY